MARPNAPRMAVDGQQTAPGLGVDQSPAPPKKGQRACLWCYKLYSPRPKGYEFCSATCEFEKQMADAALPIPMAEYRFTPPRRFRFDYAWPSRKLAVEVHGGVWTGGRHGSGIGLNSDCEKRNLANLAGWRVYEFTSDQVKSGEAIRLLRQVFELAS